MALQRPADSRDPTFNGSTQTSDIPSPRQPIYQPQQNSKHASAYEEFQALKLHYDEQISPKSKSQGSSPSKTPQRSHKKRRITEGKDSNKAPVTPPPKSLYPTPQATGEERQNDLPAAHPNLALMLLSLQAESFRKVLQFTPGTSSQQHSQIPSMHQHPDISKAYHQHQSPSSLPQMTTPPKFAQYQDPEAHVERAQQKKIQYDRQTDPLAAFNEYKAYIEKMTFPDLNAQEDLASSNYSPQSRPRTSQRLQAKRQTRGQICTASKIELPSTAPMVQPVQCVSPGSPLHILVSADLSQLQVPIARRSICKAYPAVFCCAKALAEPFGSVSSARAGKLLEFKESMQQDLRTFPVLSVDLRDACSIIQVKRTDIHPKLLQNELVCKGYLRFYVPSSQSTGEAYSEICGGTQDLVKLYLHTVSYLAVKCETHENTYQISERRKVCDDGDEVEDRDSESGPEQDSDYEHMEGYAFSSQSSSSLDTDVCAGGY